MSEIGGFEDIFKAAAIMMIKFAPNQVNTDRFIAQSIAESIKKRRGELIDQLKVTKPLKKYKTAKYSEYIIFGGNMNVKQAGY